MLEYRETAIYSEEARVLIELEELLKKAIPLIDKVKWNTFGFQVYKNHVTGLGLYSENISSLPSNFWNLTYLQVLSLTGNQLVDIPSSIVQLRDLEELYIGGNHLKLLPDSIGELTHLKYLYVLEDRLESIPKSLGQLTNLEELSIGSKNEFVIPNSVLKLKENQCRIYFNNKPL